MSILQVANSLAMASNPYQVAVNRKYSGLQRTCACRHLRKRLAKIRLCGSERDRLVGVSCHDFLALNHLAAGLFVYSTLEQVPTGGGCASRIGSACLGTRCGIEAGYGPVTCEDVAVTGQLIDVDLTNEESTNDQAITDSRCEQPVRTHWTFSLFPRRCGSR